MKIMVYIAAFIHIGIAVLAAVGEFYLAGQLTSNHCWILSSAAWALCAAITEFES